MASPTKASVNSRFWNLLKYYSRHRKWTAITLLVSLVLSFLILWWIYHLYQPIESKTYLSLAGTSDYEIINVDIHIEYSQAGTDKVGVYVSLRPTSNDVLGKVLILTKSPNLSYQKENSFFANLEYEDCRPTFSMCFRFKDAAPRTMILRFTGNAFGHGAQDERLDFSVDVSKNAVAYTVPIKIFVSNLSEVNLGTTLPEPTAKGVGMVSYDFEPSNTGAARIIISGNNTRSLYSTQFQLFLLGTMLGILLSLVTTIFLDFIQKLESAEGDLDTESDGVVDGQETRKDVGAGVVGRAEN